jgi:DNA polymerase-3 subunit alpha (Gram-positive type)
MVAVMGEQNIQLDGEFVAFDLETTGLSQRKDRIIEIGAVLMKDGKEIDRFQTFVDPGCRIQAETTTITGITNDMVKGAPSISEALPKFIEFVGDHILVAHNADFDTGFIREACKRLDIPYGYTSVDTLVLSQNLMTKLNRHKLDLVAGALGLPEFNHHRAADDAAICGMIASRFFQMLRQMDVHELQQINPAMVKIRMEQRKDERYAQHIVLFAKNQQGLRNLYHLISDANLKHFKRVPRILKSELIKLREGLIIGSACENNELFQAVIRGKSDAELKRIASFYDYLEVQPLANNRFMLDKDKNGKSIAGDEEDLRNSLELFYQFVKRLFTYAKVLICDFCASVILLKKDSEEIIDFDYFARIHKYP